MLIFKNTVELGLSSHRKIHPMIHFSYTILYFEQAKDNAPAVGDKQVPVSALIGNSMSLIKTHRRGGREFPFFSLLKEYPQYNAARQPTEAFVSRDETLPEVW